MTTITENQQLLLNTHPQRSQLYLSLFEPDIVFSCQVSGSYDSDLQTISYINPSGTTALIDGDLFLTALIGTSYNSDDKGRTWVRNATGTSQLRFVESDHIAWADGDYVTVLGYTEIIPIFPRIIQNPNDETDVIFYKNYDIAYTDQNEILGTFVNMGCDFAGFLDGGTCPVWYTTSGTSNLIADSLTYDWHFEGGTPTGSTSAVPGYVQYTTPGHYITKLTVTSNSGRVDKSVRYVSIYNRPGSGNTVPILNWILTEAPSGSRDGVGYTWRMRIRQDIPTTTIRDGMLVIIFADEWYGDTKQSIGGNSENRSTVKFSGYIKDGTIQYNYLDDSIEFDVISPTGVMEQSECFSVSVESKTTPAFWYELKDMSVSKAIYHYLAWHSTVLLRHDVRYHADDRYIQFFDADRTSLYDAINTLMSGARQGRILADRQGGIWIEQDISTLVSGSSQLSTSISIAKQDWIDQPIVDERQVSEVAFIEMGGIAYYPGSGTTQDGLGFFNAFLSDAPGVGPRYQGKVERIQGLALANQAELNQMNGQLLAWSNSRYPNVEYKLRGNFGQLDIAPQEKALLTLAPDDNVRRLNWIEKAFAIRGLSWQYDSRNQVLISNVNLAEIVTGTPGVTIIIPDIPPTDDGGGGNYEQPPLQVPPLPTSMPSGTATSGDIEIVHLRDTGVFTTYDVAQPASFSIEYLDTDNLWIISDPTKIYTPADYGTFVFNARANIQNLYGAAIDINFVLSVELYDNGDNLLRSYVAHDDRSVDDNEFITMEISGIFCTLLSGDITTVQYLLVNLYHAPPSIVGTKPSYDIWFNMYRISRATVAED